MSKLRPLTDEECNFIENNFDEIRKIVKVIVYKRKHYYRKYGNVDDFIDECLSHVVEAAVEYDPLRDKNNNKIDWHCFICIKRAISTHREIKGRRLYRKQLAISNNISQDKYKTNGFVDDEEAIKQIQKSTGIKNIKKLRNLLFRKPADPIILSHLLKPNNGLCHNNDDNEFEITFDMVSGNEPKTRSLVENPYNIVSWAELQEYIINCAKKFFCRNTKEDRFFLFYIQNCILRYANNERFLTQKEISQEIEISEPYVSVLLGKKRLKKFFDKIGIFNADTRTNRTGTKNT